MSEKIQGGHEKLTGPSTETLKELGRAGLSAASETISESASLSRSETTPKSPNDAAISEAKYFATEIYDLQMDFAGRLEALDSPMSEKEYRKWEDDFSDNWGQITKQVQRHNLGAKDEAIAEEPMIAYTVDTELHKTIEAQAGNFYHHRQSALREAIQNSTKPDDVKQKDLDFASGFATAVARHLDFKYMTHNDVLAYGPDRYESNRTKAHNDAIDYLNDLNDLCREYDTRPFTPRNFWTSRKSNQTPEIQRRMRYDRDIVEEYYALAFSSDVARREREQARDLKYGMLD